MRSTQPVPKSSSFLPEISANPAALRKRPKKRVLSSAQTITRPARAKGGKGESGNPGRRERSMGLVLAFTMEVLSTKVSRAVGRLPPPWKSPPIKTCRPSTKLLTKAIVPLPNTSNRPTTWFPWAFTTLTSVLVKVVFPKTCSKGVPVGVAIVMGLVERLAEL